MHECAVPNTHARGSVQTDFLLLTSRLVDHVLYVGMLTQSILQSDHSGMLVDLWIETIFGQHPDKLVTHKFRNIKLDDQEYPTNTEGFYTKHLNITMFTDE
jgi:hypothetical protein